MEYRSLPPATMLNPAPVVLVSCGDENGKRNLVTVAWTGTVNSEPPMVSVSLKKERYSHGLILSSGEYVINLADEPMLKAVDFCGVRSGRDLDKAEAAGLTFAPAEGMRFAPGVEGAPARLSCRVRQVLELGSHDLFLGEVVAVQVRKDLVDERGAVRLERGKLVAYSHGLYQRLGQVLGFFGYSVAREEVRQRRMAAFRNGQRREPTAAPVGRSPKAKGR
ncbi:MAG: flavin reductase family protein [Clostridia bacterium]|nr:flavin reductase family protein [Clostridia bacterium]